MCELFARTMRQSHPDTCASASNREISIFQTVISASSGAICTSLTMTPMDVVKIRLQQQVHPLAKGECFLYSNGLMEHLCTACAHPHKNLPCEWFERPGHFTGTLDAFVKIARNEGIRSLWSGLSPTIVMAIPATVFYFSTYDFLLKWYKKHFASHPFWAAPIVAGGSARLIAATLVSPIEMVRTKMQSETMSYRDVGRAIRISYQTRGWRGFYLGWSPTVWRDVPFSIIYWSALEYLREKIMKLWKRTETNFATSATSGALAGTLAALFTAPLDVVKTQRQIRLGESLVSNKADGPQKGTVTLMREIVRTRGVGALWAGCIPRIGKIAPACAIMIGSYDFWKNYFAHRNAQRRCD